MDSNDSSEVRILTEHCHDVTEALCKSPWKVGSILLSEELIPSSVMDKMNIQVYTHQYKAELLFEAIQKKILDDPKSFSRLLDIFSTCGLNETLVSKLRMLHHHSKGMYI